LDFPVKAQNTGHIRPFQNKTHMHVISPPKKTPCKKKIQTFLSHWRSTSSKALAACWYPTLPWRALYYIRPDSLTQNLKPQNSTENSKIGIFVIHKVVQQWQTRSTMIMTW